MVHSCYSEVGELASAAELHSLEAHLLQILERRIVKLGVTRRIVCDDARNDDEHSMTSTG